LTVSAVQFSREFEHLRVGLDCDDGGGGFATMFDWRGQ
jgi:hypothetical protein